MLGRYLKKAPKNKGSRLSGAGPGRGKKGKRRSSGMTAVLPETTPLLKWRQIRLVEQRLREKAEAEEEAKKRASNGHTVPTESPRKHRGTGKAKGGSMVFEVRADRSGSKMARPLPRAERRI
jgi:hypothetical protein